MGSRDNKGMTLVEMLIAMAILGVVLLITSSGIIQSLQVNRLVEDAANTQSKLRRITEVVAQELRSAVMGGMVDSPVVSSSSGISFVLLSGDGGLPVTGNSHPLRTEVFASDVRILEDIVDSPALILHSSGQAFLIDKIDSFSGLGLGHNECPIHINHPVGSRLYAANILGFEYDAGSQTLYQYTLDQSGGQRMPFAFGLSRFELAYEYDAGAGNTRVLSTPHAENNLPAPVFEDGGDTFQLSRLRLTLASQSANDDVEREYVTYIELTGTGNDSLTNRTISEFVPCNFSAPVEPDPGSGGGGGDGGDGGDGGSGGDGGDGGDDGGGSDDDDGGNDGGGGNDDDRGPRNCGFRNLWCLLPWPW